MRLRPTCVCVAGTINLKVVYFRVSKLFGTVAGDNCVEFRFRLFVSQTIFLPFVFDIFTLSLVVGKSWKEVGTICETDRRYRSEDSPSRPRTEDLFLCRTLLRTVAQAYGS